MFLNEMYDKEYYRSKAKSVENVLGPALQREEESTFDFSQTGYHIECYRRFEIHKFFNLNINEFLDTTPYFKVILIQQAKIAMEALKVEMEKLKTANDN